MMENVILPDLESQTESHRVKLLYVEQGRDILLKRVRKRSSHHHKVSWLTHNQRCEKKQRQQELQCVYHVVLRLNKLVGNLLNISLFREVFQLIIMLRLSI